MKIIEEAEFKDRCLTLLDQLDPDGVIVTRDGKPVARVLPFESPHADLIGSLRHKITIKGDILGTGVRWNANSR